MTNAKLKLMINVFRNRISSGETFDEIATSYPKLTEEDLILIKEGLNNG